VEPLYKNGKLFMVISCITLFSPVYCLRLLIPIQGYWGTPLYECCLLPLYG